MKFLNYKNKFLLIFDIIFNFDKFISNFKKYEINKLKDIRIEYENKLDELKFEEECKGILDNDFNKNKIPIISIPTVHVNEENLNSSIKTSIQYKNVDKLSISYMNENLKLDDIKNEAAISLSKELIQRNFIQNQIHNDKIVFYIKTFQ